jgi:type IV pilus assembly protein PilA
MNSAQKGFTQIELVIVIAVIAILAAIASPAWLDYNIRKQIKEGWLIASDAKTAIDDFYLSKGKFPASGQEVGISENAAGIKGNYVVGIEVSNGSITVTYGASANAKINGKTLTLTPKKIDDTTLVWYCSQDDELTNNSSHSSLGKDNTQINTLVNTNIDKKYLPQGCEYR